MGQTPREPLEGGIPAQQTCIQLVNCEVEPLSFMLVGSRIGMIYGTPTTINDNDAQAYYDRVLLVLLSYSLLILVIPST